MLGNQDILRANVAAIIMAPLMNDYDDSDVAARQAREAADALLLEIEQTSKISNEKTQQKQSVHLGPCGCRADVLINNIDSYGNTNVRSPGFMTLNFVWCQKHNEDFTKGGLKNVAEAEKPQ